MGFTRSTTDISVHQKLGDYPNQDNGLTPEELKKRYDKPAETLQKDLNNLETELENENASNKIGAIKIDDSDESENNIFAKLKMLSGRIREAVLSQIPDGTITKNKLLPKYENSLARKHNLGKLYLASQYRTPEIELETPQDYIMPKLTSDNHEGYEVTWQYYKKTDSLTSPYDMFGGDGNSSISTDEGTAFSTKTAEIKIEFPKYLKIENISFTGEKLYLKIWGSNDNEAWHRLDNDSIFVYNDGEKYKYNETLSINEYYKYIKLQLVAPYPGRMGYKAYIYNDIVISGKVLNTLEQNKMKIIAKEDNEILDSYVEGQVLKLKTPDNYIDATTINSTINVYDLGAKSIPNDLQAGKRYSLVYDGQKFIHESEVE